MANQLLWKAASSRGDIITNQTINDNAGKLSSEVDNSTNLDRWAVFQLFVNLAATGVDGVFELYLIYALDGTNYGIGDDTAKPPSQKLVATFTPEDDATNDQRIETITPVLILPFKFKAVLWNECGQNTDASTTDLACWTFNEDLQ